MMGGSKKKTTTKIAVEGVVRIRSWDVISDRVESAVKYGISRAHKHTNRPSFEAMEDEIYRAVMDGLAEILSFGDDADS